MPVVAPAQTLSEAQRRYGRLKPPPFWDLAPGMRYEMLFDQTESVPDIMEFCHSDKYLNRPSIYPRQATFLKLMFLQDELFTGYDLDVLDEWSSKFRLDVDQKGDELRYMGGWGLQPDWETRLQINKADGAKWFREVLPVLGRRASKGYLGGIAGAYVLYHYIMLGNVHKHFGVDEDKRLYMFVFGAKQEQARINQYADIVNVITSAPIFQLYMGKPLANHLPIFSRYDGKRWQALCDQGLENTAMDYATFHIAAKESTLTAGRGPASIVQYYDEMSHVDKNTARAAAEDVYAAATPSLDTFGNYAFLYEGSSPWQMTGQFYENWLQSLSVDARSLRPVRPDMLMLQLRSWDLYEDFEVAHDLPIAPAIQADGWSSKVHFFPTFDQAPQTYNDQMKRLERANPERFKVERLSQWATVQNAYLTQHKVEEMFSRTFDDGVLQIEAPLRPTTFGRMDVRYEMHTDPSKSGDNTATAVAHLTEPDAQGYRHVVVDQLLSWKPSDFPNGEIDYNVIEMELREQIKMFMPQSVTFDQFGGVQLIQRLRMWLGSQANLPKTVQVMEQTATHKLNWQMAECFKTALNMGLIHSPRSDILSAECQFLILAGPERVDHPTSGPVTSKDSFDALANVVWRLIGQEMMQFLFGDITVSGSQASGSPQPAMVPQSTELNFPSPMNRNRW